MAATQVWSSETLTCSVTKRRRSMMTKFTLLGVAANLSTAIATTSLAQAAIQEMGAYASYRQDGNLGIAHQFSDEK